MCGSESHAGILPGLNRTVSMADGSLVSDTALISWVLIAVAVATAVLSVLWTMAESVRSATAIHDLRVRVHTLRVRRLERLRELEAASQPESEPLEANARAA